MARGRKKGSARCACGSAAPASLPGEASGWPKSPAVRGGQGRTRAKLLPLPPGLFPSQTRYQPSQSGPLTPSSPPPSRGLASAQSLSAVPRTLCRLLDPPTPARQPAGSERGPRGRTERRSVWDPRGPLPSPPPPGFRLGRKEVLVRDLGRRRCACALCVSGSEGFLEKTSK